MNKLVSLDIRLKGLMIENSISVKELSSSIKVSESAIKSWLLYDANLTLTNLVKLADFFKCSIEYLIGRSDNASEYLPVVCPDFVKRLKNILSEKDKSTYSLDKDTKIKDIYISRWNRGTEPLLSSLLVLSEYLDCTIDYLLGRE